MPILVRIGWLAMLCGALVVSPCAGCAPKENSAMQDAAPPVAPTSATGDAAQPARAETEPEAETSEPRPGVAETGKGPAETAAEPKEQPDAKADWITSLDQAMKAAKDQNKLIFVEFWAEWCVYCKMLETGTFADAGVRKAMEGYVKLRVDVDKDKDVAARYSVAQVPVIVIADAQGAVLARVGGLPPNVMLQFLGDVGAYLAAKEKLAKDAKDPEAAYTVAEKSFAMEMPADERTKLVNVAMGLVKKEDVPRRGKLLMLRGYLVAVSDDTKLDDAMKDFEAAAAVDALNESGVKEEADWLLARARFQKSRNPDEFAKTVDKYLADYPKDKIKNADIRNQVLGFQYKLRMDREDYAGAIKTLELIKAENKDLPNVDQLDAAIEQVRAQMKAAEEEKTAPEAQQPPGTPAPKSDAPAPKEEKESQK